MTRPTNRFARAALIPVVACFALAGCGGAKEPPTPSGPWQVLAPGLWDMDPGRVTPPPMPGSGS